MGDLPEETTEEKAAPEEVSEEETTEEEAAEEGLRVSVERTAPCVCVIRVEADADHLRERYQDELTSLQGEIELPGFRRGRAPIGLVERRMGSSLRQDLLSSVLSEGYEQAVEDNDLHVVAETDVPDPEEMDWEPGQPAEFEFHLEVLPEVELSEADYQNLQIEVPAAEVTDEMFQEELERFAGQFATWEEVEEGGIDWDDYVEAEVSVPDVEWSETIGFYPRAERIGPFDVEGIKGALMDAQAGSEVELEGELLEDEIGGREELEELAGQKVTLSVAVQEVMRRRVPEVDDDLAEKLGLSDAEELRELVRDRLNGRMEEQQQNIQQQMIRRTLLEKMDLPLPESLVERARQDEERRMLVRMLRNGVPRDEAERRAYGQAEQTRAVVENRLRVDLLLREIADMERILVTESEVNSQIRAFASRQGWREDRARDYLEEQGVVRTLRNDIRESKTLEFLADNAEIKEIPAEEFAQKYGGEPPEADEETPGADEG